MTRLQEDNRLIKQIADRAADLYDRIGVKVNPNYIAVELRLVHEEIYKLRLKDFLEADDSNFAHDIGGIHQHLVIGKETRLDGCFVPRFAVSN